MLSWDLASLKTCEWERRGKSEFDLYGNTAQNINLSGIFVVSCLDHFTAQLFPEDNTYFLFQDIDHSTCNPEYFDKGT